MGWWEERSCFGGFLRWGSGDGTNLSLFVYCFESFWKGLLPEPEEDGKSLYGIAGCSIEFLLSNSAEALGKDGEECEDGGKEEEEKKEIE